MMPAERVYARMRGGQYEEMYRGAAGQVLHLPKDSRWAADLTADTLQQRGFKGWFDKRKYNTVTGFAALHYKLPYDITTTARAGRFLVKDNGGQEHHESGHPANPYNDMGIHLSVPLNINVAD